jgi:hypothetical protein
MNATEKRRVLAQWQRFLQTLARRYGDPNRCLQAFGLSLYDHLVQHCSFIAHYNRHGFYTHYFESADSTIKFLNQFDESVNPDGLCAEYSMASWLKGESADINTAMREVAGRYIHGVIAMASEWQRRADLIHAHRLAARHGHTLTAA